jgi:hypothetical protein
MRIGFTGTRQGMTSAQKLAFLQILAMMKATVLVHGDCVGADADAHRTAHAVGMEVEIRPCNFLNMRAHCEGATKTYPVTTALARNRDIVDRCDAVIATPATAEEQSRGGTWYTIRYALKIKRPLFIIDPDGQTHER